MSKGLKATTRPVLLVCAGTPGSLLPALAEMAGRVIQLQGDAPDGVRRVLSQLRNLSLDGDKPQTWETVTRTGTFYDRRYGEFEITLQMLQQMVKNFDEKVYGQDIFVDVAHDVDGGAAAKIVKLAVEGNKLRALLEWTPHGVDAVKKRHFVYLSAEYVENYQDNEKRAQHGAVLQGAGLTIRPAIKHLDAINPARIQLSEAKPSDVPTLALPELQTKFLQEVQAMWKKLLEELTAKLKSFKLADAVVLSLIGAAEKALGPVTEEPAAKALIAEFEKSGKTLAEQIGDKVVTLNIQAPAAAATITKEDVARILQEAQDKATKDASETKARLDGNVKIFSDAITAATGIPDELKKNLTEAVQGLITAEMSADQVKMLAAAQIKSGNEIVSARALAGLGYTVAGTTHITVDSMNEIKSLQETVDKRAGFEGMALSERYPLSDGAYIERNKKLVEKVLAEFDARNGHRLSRERKIMLAGGSGDIGDIAVPAWWERTVIREALYDLVSLPLFDVGTAPFTTAIQIPYSYRDTTAAGRESVRVYEGQGIPRAGIKQTMDEARPLPQKLSFLVSHEMMMLAANGQLAGWDAVMENMRNASRIIGEDTEHTNFNNLLAASDQYATAEHAGENLELQADDVLKVFLLANWPVARPKKVYDLQGAQVGATVNPVTVTYNAVARAEYDGTGTQADGIYYVLNYDLGEIYLVDEAGAIQLPANGTAYTITYSSTSNVAKWNTDLGVDEEVDRHWDDFLYRFALRKNVIEDERFYKADVAIMSGTVRTQIEQAKQFGANSKRPGTDLLADGNLGRIKDVPSFKSSAPGLHIGDRRVLIGQRGIGRFRMVKGWTMEQLENARNVTTGLFTAEKEAFGTQWIVSHVPIPLKAALTSMVLYSEVARVARAAP